MNDTQKKPQVFQIQCPCCRSLLWVDPKIRQVIKSEKAKSEKGSLDALLEQEKRRKGEFDRKFEATAEMEKERLKKAQEKFRKAITGLETEDTD